MIEISNKIQDTLYKYGNWDNCNQKRLLTESEIYFAAASQFNDPFDAKLPFVYDKTELTTDNILAKLMATSSNKHLSHEDLLAEAKEKMRHTDFKSPKYLNDANDRLKEFLISSFGIFSMTKNNKNLLMWSHYADKHKGFCVGISKKALSLINFTQLINIEYSNSFPKRPMFVPDNRSNEYLLKLVATKSRHWKYENEIRLISFKPKIAITLPQDFISEIIFGVAMSEDHKNEITALRNSKFPTAKLFQAELDRNKFKIKFKTLTQTGH